MPSPRAAIFQNHVESGADLVGDFLAERGWACATYPPDQLAGLDRPPAADLSIFLGSAYSAYQTDIPWIAEQRRLARSLLRDDRPVLGICFGAQLLAGELGGTVKPMPAACEGWMTNDRCAGEAWAGPWLRWHGDRLTVPATAEVLASDAGVTQAFRRGRTVGVQFHPEMSGDGLRRWMRHPAYRTGPKADLLARLAVHADDHAAAIRARAFGLFSLILAMILEDGPSSTIRNPRCPT